MKILFFSPFSGIWTHALPEALIASSLESYGHDIKYIYCDKSFEGFCTAMSAVGLTNLSSEKEKNDVCSKCQSRKDIILKEFQYEGYSIKSQLMTEDYNEIELFTEKISPSNICEFKIDDIEIGKLTLYQILLEFKKSSLDFTEEQWSRVKVDFKNTLLSFYAARKIFKNEKPDVVILYNALYSVNHVVCKIADKLNVKQYFLHAGGSLAHKAETIIIEAGDAFKYYRNLVDFWEIAKSLPCSKEEIKKVSMHIDAVLKAHTLFSYSIKVGKRQPDIRKYFKIKQHQKVLLATMSSNDERYAANVVNVIEPGKNLLFPSQIEWLTELINYVKSRKDLFLVIRVHPREFPNKRESVKSENSVRLEKLFIDLPDNIKVNWPSDEISLYHLAQEIDVCLNSWSSAGKELTALGIPVLLYSKEIQIYSSDINYLGETHESYFLELERALNVGWSFEHVRKAYRWYATEYFRTTLDLSDGYKNKKNYLINRITRKVVNLVSDSALDVLDCKFKPKTLKASSVINDIIGNKRDSYFDILRNNSQKVNDELNETFLLRKHVKKLFNFLKQNNTKMTPLLRNMQKFIESSVDEVEYLKIIK